MSDLQQEKQMLISELEKAAHDILMLRKNYDVQVNHNNMVRDELRAKEEQYRNKIQVLENEMTAFME